MSDTIIESESALATPRQKANPAELIGWVKGDIMDGFSMGQYNKMLRAQRTRSCWWEGKQAEGTAASLPYGTRQAQPWPGAVDHEVRVVDQRCNEEVDLAMMTWYRSEKIIRPRDAMNDEQVRRAEAWRHGLEFYLDATKNSLQSALELFANAISEFGQAVWYEGWEDRWRRGRKSMKWDDVTTAMTQKALQDAAAMNPEAQISDEEMQMIHEGTVAMAELMRQSPDLDPEFQKQIMGLDPLISTAEARKVISGFRKGESSVDYFAPVPVTPMPTHRCFIPGVDCFYPMLSRSGGQVPRMAFIEWKTEAQIRTESEQDGWDKDFTEELLKTQRGLSFDLQAWGAQGTFTWELNGFDMGMQYNAQALNNAGLYQMITMWWWGVGDDGLPAPYRTLLHPNITTSVAKQDCDPYKHGQMPWTLKTRDHKRSLAISSRGVPDEMLTNQLGRKKLEDAMISQTELRSNPPRLETSDGGGDGMRPGAILAVSNRFLTGQGGGPRFMDVPDISGGSIRMLEWLKQEEDSYYLKGEHADPEAKRARMVRAIGRWCSIYEEIIMLMALNMQHGVTEIQLGSVAGAEVNWTIQGEDLQGELDVVVRCDEGSIDPDLAMKKLEMLSKFGIQLDRTGQMPWEKVFRQAMQMIWPDMASSIPSRAVATDRIKSDEKQRISQMASGQPLEYQQQADAPDIRKQVMDEWTQYPVNQQRIMGDPMLQEQVQREYEWLNFAVQQQQVNPQTGRTGVSPEIKSAPQPQMQMA